MYNYSVCHKKNYSSITEELLNKALNFIQQFINIVGDEIKKNCQMSYPFYKNSI